MAIRTLTDESVERMTSELGERINRARLEANITQSDLAKRAGLSVNAIKNAEKGSSTLESIVRILMALNMDDQLESFIPERPISPIQVSDHSKRKIRERASSHKSPGNSKETDW